jgi:hypothetical protein
MADREKGREKQNFDHLRLKTGKTRQNPQKIPALSRFSHDPVPSICKKSSVVMAIMLG